MASRPPDLPGLLARLARVLDAQRLPFMLIGGQAVLVHGVPRLTEDIDVTLGVDPGQLPRVLDICREADLAPLVPDVEAFVRETFVLPVRDGATAMRVDFVFSTTPYERQAIARAVRIQLGETPIPFATAEDLIIHKVFAGRPRDWEDAVGVARRAGSRLDWAYVGRWAAEFAVVPGREDLPDRAERLRREAGA
jgi:hypothetical protein